MPAFIVWLSMFGYVALAAAFVMAVVRMVRGPSLPDRIVALDMLAYLAVGFIALTSLVSGQPIFLDVALALALIAFLAVVAFARYVEQTYGVDRPADEQS
jgi:multicomponent Na+:H+ antiporter subunit F